jgi:delta-aminolevulinic acid dehydratase/porphobilinogen synthase
MILFNERWPEWDQVNTYIIISPKFMCYATRAKSFLFQPFAKAIKVVPAVHGRYRVYVFGFSASRALRRVKYNLRNGRTDQNEPPALFTENA